MGHSVSEERTHRAVMGRLERLAETADARCRQVMIASCAYRLALAAQQAIDGENELLLGTVRDAAVVMADEARRLTDAILAVEALLLQAGRPDLAAAVTVKLAGKG